VVLLNYNIQIAGCSGHPHRQPSCCRLRRGRFPCCYGPQLPGSGRRRWWISGDLGCPRPCSSDHQPSLTTVRAGVTTGKACWALTCVAIRDMARRVGCKTSGCRNPDVQADSMQLGIAMHQQASRACLCTGSCKCAGCPEGRLHGRSVRRLAGEPS
jgi:hypothetical protein